jgi:hypothetical protein
MTLIDDLRDALVFIEDHAGATAIRVAARSQRRALEQYEVVEGCAEEVNRWEFYPDVPEPRDEGEHLALLLVKKPEEQP